jgi:hypothetical protein
MSGCFTASETGSGIRAIGNLTCTKTNPGCCHDSKADRSDHIQSGMHMYMCVHGSTRWRSSLRHCTASRRVTGSIPDRVTGICHWHNPFGHTMALGSTQPLTEMSTRNISMGGKGGRCVVLTTLPPTRADCLKIWEPQPTGTLRTCPGP